MIIIFVRMMTLSRVLCIRCTIFQLAVLGQKR